MNSEKEVSWEKILTDYVRHQRAYQESMNKVEDLNPIVWSWSDASLLPSFNPTVYNTAASEVEREKKRMTDQHKILKEIETVAKNMVARGNMVTADLLQRYAPPGTSPQALAMALGISEQGKIPGDTSGELLMAKYAYARHRELEKAWDDTLEPLRKDAPMEAHADKFGMKGGMKMRWDAAHNYKGFNLVKESFRDMDIHDQEALRNAARITGKSISSFKTRNGYKVFVWLRPGQEDFFQREMAAYTQKHTQNGQLTPEAARHIQKVKDEREQILTGKIKRYRHAERYREDVVQPGTIAAKNIKMGTTDSHGPKAGHNLTPEQAFAQYVATSQQKGKQMIPHEGQHGPTAALMHPGEADRMKVQRPAIGPRTAAERAATGPVARTEPEKVKGVTFRELWAATANPRYAPGRRDAAHRSVIAPGGQMIPARTRPTTRRNTTILADVVDSSGKRYGRKISEGAWRDLAESVIDSGTVKVVRNGQEQDVALSARERANLVEAATRIGLDRGMIKDPSEFAQLRSRDQKSLMTAVVYELHKNRFSNIFGTKLQRETARQRHEANIAAGRTSARRNPPGRPATPEVVAQPIARSLSAMDAYTKGRITDKNPMKKVNVPEGPSTDQPLGIGVVKPAAVMRGSPRMQRPKAPNTGKPDVFRSMSMQSLSDVRDTKESIRARSEIIAPPTQQIPEEDSNRAKGPSPNKSTNDPAFKKLIEAVSKAENNVEELLNPDRSINKLPPQNRNHPTKSPNPKINARIALETTMARQGAED